MLTPKQQRFALEYLVDLNATQAAIRAGYSPKTASEQGARLFRNVQVKNFLASERQARAARTAISRERVLKELSRLGYSDIRQVVEWDTKGVRLKPSAELDDDTAAAIAEVTQRKDGTLRVKMHPKLPALELLARHLALFEPESRVDAREMARKITLAYREMIEAGDVPSPFVNN